MRILNNSFIFDTWNINRTDLTLFNVAVQHEKEKSKESIDN